MTYEEARKWSIKVWEWRVKEPLLSHRRIKERLLKERGRILAENCGFCEFYKSDCPLCPLWWEEAKHERNSAFMVYYDPCSRNYWHYIYWNVNYNEAWARKMLAEIKATPEREEV